MALKVITNVFGHQISELNTVKLAWPGLVGLAIFNKTETGSSDGHS